VHRYLLIWGSICGSVLLTSLGWAQEPSRAAKPPSAEEQAKLGGPGEEHERLNRYAGTWDVDITMGGGKAAMTYHGSAASKMTIGGRFLQIEHQAEGKAGATEGMFVIGFDQRHKRHTLIAMDSFGTYYVTSQGKRDEATGKIRMLGADDDPMMKSMGYTKEFVHVLDLRSADDFAIEVWLVDTRTPARREMKFMEYTFKRKPSVAD
jgi:hypothetical protein